MFYIFGGIFALISLLLALNIYKILPEQRKLVFWIFVFIASLLCAMRPEYAPDFPNYKKIFDYIQPHADYGLNLLKKNYATGTEYGFIYFVAFFKNIIGDKFRVFLWLVSFVSMSLSITNLKRIMVDLHALDEDDYYGSEFIMLNLYFSYFFLCYDCIAIRALISIAFSVVGFRFFVEKKYFYCVLFYILGFSVQRMTIIGTAPILIYIFFPTLKNKKNLIRVLVVFLIGFFVFYKTPLYSSFLSSINSLYDAIFAKISYARYTENIEMTAVIDKKKFFLLVILMYILAYIEDDIGVKKIFNILIGSIVIMFCTMNISGAARIYDYLAIYYLPLIGCNAGKVRYNNLYKIIYCMLLIANYIISFRVWGVI